MEDILLKLAIVAMVLFIFWNIYEIITAHIVYKKMTKEYKEMINKLINNTVEEMLSDKDEE